MATKTGITVAEVKAGPLFGLPLTDAAGNEMSDATIENLIRAAEDEYERDLPILFGEHTIGAPSTSTSYDVLDPGYDYRAEDFDFAGNQTNWHTIATRFLPLREITTIRFYFQENAQLDLPGSWAREDAFHGYIRMFPNYETISIWHGMVARYFTAFYYVPAGIHLEYTAGMTQAELLADHMDLRTAVMNFAGLFVIRNRLPFLIKDGAGVSRGVPGVDHDFSGRDAMLAMYGDLMRQDKEFRARWRDTTQGPNLIMV